LINLYIGLASVKHGIDAALSAVLRLYHTHVRHLLFLADPEDKEEWDYAQGQVWRRQTEQHGVEGQLWI
jgi:hypothetical protein